MALSGSNPLNMADSSCKVWKYMRIMERCGNVEIGKVRHISKVAEEVSSVKKISKKPRFDFLQKLQIVDKVCFSNQNQTFFMIFLK